LAHVSDCFSRDSWKHHLVAPAAPPS
jgi:hypothetical protein